MPESALDFEPTLIAFVCNWCTYGAADLAGVSRMQYPPNVRVVRIPCTGRMSPLMILRAFEQVDVIINFDLKGKRRKKIHTAAGAVPILGLDDLVKMKRAAGRPQDIEDANALEKLR